MLVYLKEPALEEYWYEQKILADPLSMEYNAGWDVFYDGYDYNTGCISFPEERWENNFNKRKGNDKYFAYVVSIEDNKFVGKVNFQYDNKENNWFCGIVIEHSQRGKGYGKEALKLLCEVAFNQYNVDALYDGFDLERDSIKIFEDIGFKKTREIAAKRFNKDIKTIEVCLKKSEFEEVIECEDYI